MTKKAFYLLLFFLLLLTACTTEDSAKNHETEDVQRKESAPMITSIKTNFPEKEGWVVVPANSSDLTVTVETTHAETLLFWSVPTGTETWGERELIGYDTSGNDGWKITWNIAGKSLHNRLVVQALGSDGKTITDETINITNE
ncbi:hypothetical protein J7E78_00020 [Paenibacillus polymyxa]|uniref:hypothetical protein n=1 Tax=Paenibacillus polymyxa TaxID=1406 RepID=UPI001BE6BC49|nr:hypothetical protein [Paenibacillus polymyxa]MBT2281946.1 hypothetical protein [Paenibacillus polymyxa]